MKNMEYLKEFVQILTGSEDSISASGRAFGLIAEEYRIGKVSMEYVTPSSVYTRRGAKREFVLFDAGAAISQEIGFCREFHTGEGGTARFILQNTEGAAPFSKEEESELEPALGVLFLHCVRWRLITHVKKLCLTDGLTGVLNSEGYLAHAEDLLQRKELAGYNAFYFNLARFSLLNKRFGAQETDVILIRYAQIVSAFLQQGECIGRLGGDNFVALVRKERTDAFLALIAGVETYGMLGEQEVPVRISAVAGVFVIDENVTHCGMLIGECSTALDIARHVEKKPYVFASEEVRQRMLQEKQMADSFAEALDKGAFKAYYQPKVETDTYRIVGAEALARLEYEGKLSPPITFVPVLERNGMICALDFYILEQVCRDIRGWMNAGIEPVRVSVNLSRKHLANPNLSEEIMAILAKYEMESSYIELELTETVEEAEVKQIVTFMKKMKEYDISLSIDDFGTGYSSLNLLRSFPVDVLKLDKTFLNSLEENDRIVLSNIIRMASELHMGVVAEGVENWNQLDYLKQMSCNVVQGFLFDRPLPKPEFEEKLRAGKYAVEKPE